MTDPRHLDRRPQLLQRGPLVGATRQTGVDLFAEAAGKVGAKPAQRPLAASLPDP